MHALLFLVKILLLRALIFMRYYFFFSDVCTFENINIDAVFITLSEFCTLEGALIDAVLFLVKHLQLRAYYYCWSSHFMKVADESI